jgi:16S rRNA (guanine966-N2)-methyltransferase
MRIIAGEFRSRQITAPVGEATRPTSDKLRGTLFNILAAMGLVEGIRFLDLYAGSGAVAIEAISRGAAHAFLVENDRDALKALHKNLKSLNLASEVTVMDRDVANAIHALERLSRFDVVFLDPPWKDEAAYSHTLEQLSRSKLIDAATIVIAEHEKHFHPEEKYGLLVRFREHKQGDAVLSFYRIQD